VLSLMDLHGPRGQELIMPHRCFPRWRRQLTGGLCGGVLLLGCATPGPVPRETALPQSADQWYRQGRAAQQAGGAAAARLAYGHALRLAPGHRHAGNGLAALWAADGQPWRAIGLWQELLRRDGATAGADSAFLLRNMAQAQLLAGATTAASITLEQACLAEPRNAAGWLLLGAVLAQLGQGERGARMVRQGQSLLRHSATDGATDGAADNAAPVAPAPLTAAPQAAAAVPDGLARSELVLSASGMVTLRRIEPAAAAATTGAAAAAVTVAAPALEIRNGNGVPGLAAALARLMPVAVVVRLGNEPGFAVRRSRVDYQPQYAAAAGLLAARLGLAVAAESGCRRAGVCIVLGRDVGDGSALLRRYRDGLALVPPPAQPAG
jgi:tetratricopeptide (TPR) repeat protein